MAGAFDPYSQWLGIERDGFHPDRYQLLGLPALEADPHRIGDAARRRSDRLAVHLAGENADLAQRVLDEIESARAALVDPAKKATYDAILRRQLEQRGALPTPAAAPVAAAPAASDADIDSLLPPTSGAPTAPAEPPPSPAYPQPGYPQPAHAQPAPYAGAPAAIPQAVAYVPSAVPHDPSAWPGYPPPAAAYASPAAYAPQAVPYPPPSGHPMQAEPYPAAAPAYGYAAPVAMAAPPETPYAAAAYSPSPYAAAPYAAPAYAPPPQPDPTPAVSASTSPTVRARRSKSAAPVLMALFVPVALVGLVGVGFVALKKQGLIGKPANSNGTTVASNGAEQGDEVRPSRDRNPPVAPADDSEDRPPVTPADVDPIDRPTPAEDDPPADPADDMPADDEPAEDMPDEDMPATDMPDEPDPDEPATDKPTDEPATDMPEESMPADVDVPQALMVARYALAHKDVSLARRQIEAVLAAEAEGDLAVEASRVQKLVEYVEQFWKAFDESLNSLAEGSDFAVGTDDRASVVEKGPNLLIVRARGENREYALDDLPPKLAVALAENWLAKNDAVSKLVVGAYLAIHPKADRDDARAALMQADLMGKEQEVALLLPELEVELPTEMPEVAAADGDDPPAGGTTGRLPVPAEAAQTQAVDEIRAGRPDEFAAATGTAEMTVLADKLITEGMDAADDPTRRYAMLLEAATLAARAGDLETLPRAADALASLYEIDAWDVRVDAIVAASKDLDDAALQAGIVEAGLALYDDAVIDERYDAAKKIARATLAAARKAKDPELLKEAAARNTEAGKLK